MYNEMEKFEIDCYADIINNKEKKESFNKFLNNINSNRNRRVIGTADEPEGVPKAAIAALGAGMGTAGWIIFGVTAVISIGVLIYTLMAKKDDKESEPDYYNPQYGFESVAELASYGDVIPIIYGKRGTRLTENTADGNPFGGVRIGGKLINSRVDTINGTSTMFNLYVIGQGEIGYIDVNESYINNEPVKDLTDDITILWTEGTQSQVPIETTEDGIWFKKQSQTIQVNNNNTCSCHKIADINKVELSTRVEEEITVAVSEYPYVIKQDSIAKADKEEYWYKTCRVRTLGTSVTQRTERIIDYNGNSQSFQTMYADSPRGVGVNMDVRKPRYKPTFKWELPVLFSTQLLAKGSYFEFELMTNKPLMVVLSRETESTGGINYYNSVKYPKRNGGVMSETEVDGRHSPVVNCVGGIGRYLDAFDYLEEREEIDCGEPDIDWTQTEYPYVGGTSFHSRNFWYMPDPRLGGEWTEISGDYMQEGVKFRIWISEEGNIEYWRNSGSSGWLIMPGSQTTPYDDPGNPHLGQPPYSIWFYANHPGAGIKNLVWSNSYESTVGSIGNVTRDVETTEIEIVEAESDESTKYDIQKFNLTDIYQACDAAYNNKEEFRVVKKDMVTNKITVNKNLTIADDSLEEIWKISRFRMTTTKKVTEVNLNLAILLYARYKPESDGGERGGKK